MSKKGYSLPNFWGGYDHYDENGNQNGSDIYNPEGKLIRSWYYDETGKMVNQEFTW